MPTTSTDELNSPLLAIKVIGGLVKDLSQQKKAAPTDPDWVLNATHFAIECRSSLPINQASPASAGASITVAPTPQPFGILPMHIAQATGQLDVTLTLNEEVSKTLISAQVAPESLVVVEPIADGVFAAAHWMSWEAGQSPPTPDAGLTISGTCGYRLKAGRPKPESSSPLPLRILLGDPIPLTAQSDRPADRLATYDPFSA